MAVVAVPVRIAHPYIATVRIRGVTDLLLNRWRERRDMSDEDYEAYVYRTPTGDLGIPGAYLRGAIVQAADFYGLAEVFRSGIACFPDVASIGKRTRKKSNMRCRGGLGVAERSAEGDLLPHA